MFKENQRVDHTFQLIKKITPVIVVLYMLFCWFIIRKSAHDTARSKSNFSLVTNGNLAVQEGAITLKSAP